MSQRLVRFHPAAVEEAEATVEWYAAKSRRVAYRFVVELEQALDSISKSPDQWPIFEGPARRIRFCGFPYAVIYRVLEDRLEVLAVAHGRRRPGYWMERTG